MLKWVSWVIRMGATALLLSFLCIWTTGYIVNSYMETVIKKLDLPIDTQPFALSGVWGKLWGADKYPQPEATSASKTPTGQASKAESTAEIKTDTNESVPVTDQEGSTSVLTPADEVESVNPGGEANLGPSPDSGDVGSDPVFNGQGGAGQLTDSERQALYALVVSKLSQDQLKLLSDSLKGGLTTEELGQLDNMLKVSLSAKEYVQMMEMLKGKVSPAGTGSGTGAAEQ